MTSTERWKEAQAAESEFWTGIPESTTREALDVNRAEAEFLQSWVAELPSPELEIGVGGLGVGLVGFLPANSLRIGTDPLPLVTPCCSDELLREVLARRGSLHFVRAAGECLPFQDRCIGLAVCYNVLDHVNDAPLVLEEIFRVLCPEGLLFLKVDTFSYLGLAKWHLWTKRAHANEILVRAHPYRFSERAVEVLCRQAGFEIVRTEERRPLDRWVGRSFRSAFLARKPLGKAR